MNQLDDKIAVITGATSGIGEATARRFVKAGAKVIIAGRNEERGQRLESEIGDSKRLAEFIHVDVTDTESVSNLRNEVLKRFGRVDILFNNAGIFPPVPSLEESNEEQWKEIFDINSTGVYRVTKAFIPHIIETGGNILNNASVAGMQSFASGRVYAYGASKAAVIQFTRMLAKIYGDRIRVNCICPGVVDTPIFINRDFSRYESIIPMKRVAQPEDIAKVANFLVSDDAGYINGIVVPVDGGQSL